LCGTSKKRVGVVWVGMGVGWGGRVHTLCVPQLKRKLNANNTTHN